MQTEDSKNVEKRILIAGFPADATTAEITKNLSKYGVRTSVAILGETRENNTSLDECEIISEYTLYDLPQLRKMAPALSFEGSDFIRKHYPIILRSQERWLFTRMNIDDRIFIIDLLFSYFVHLISKHKINAILHSTGTPHHFWNLVLNFAGDYKGVPNLFHTANEFTNRVRFGLGLEFNLIPIKGVGSEKEKTDAFIERFSEKKIVAPWLSSNLKKTSNFKILHFIFRQGPRLVRYNLSMIYHRKPTTYLFWRDHPLRFIVRRFSKVLSNIASVYRYRRIYMRKITNEIKPKSIVMYAHFQPEATSHPNGGRFPDMRYWARYLKTQADHVYYKEHITTFFYSDIMGEENPINCHRSDQYFNDLENLGTIFLNPRRPTWKVFQEAQAIFTFSGSVILEALFHKVPIYYTGHAWHGPLPAEKVTDLGDGIQVRYLDGSEESIQSTRNHLHKLDQASFPNVYGWQTGVRDPKFSLEQYAKILSESLNLAEEMVKGQSLG